MISGVHKIKTKKFDNQKLDIIIEWGRCHDAILKGKIENEIS